MTDTAWRLVLHALAAIGGFERTVFYDVPSTEAPQHSSSTGVSVHGSAAWRRFLAARSRFDDGRSTLLLSLRPLDDGERRLAVGWGCRYANTFLLVEPSNPVCDLTDPANAVRRDLEARAARIVEEHRGSGGRDSDAPIPAGLRAAVRAHFGRWIVWPEPFSEAPTDSVAIRPHGSEDSLRRRLTAAIAARYPQARYDEAIVQLYTRERELFGGTVAEARRPFLTRLGLPVLDDPRRVDLAVRRMVNEGHASVIGAGVDPAFYRGPRRPLPDAMTDAEIERLVVR